MCMIRIITIFIQLRDFERPIEFSVNEAPRKLSAEFLKNSVHPCDKVDITIGKDAAGKVRFIPGGYGIYCFPLYNDVSGYPVLTACDLQTVFSVDADRVWIASFKLNAEENRFLLVTPEDGIYMLTA